VKNWRARVPIGAALIAAIVGIVSADAKSPVPWIAPALTALLGAGAFLEYCAMNPDARRGFPRSVAVWFAFALAAVPLARRFGVGGAWADRLSAPDAVAALAAGVVAAGFAGLVFRRARTATELGDLREASAVAAGLALTVLPLHALGAVASVGGGAGPWILLGTVLLTKLNDIGGYLFGGMIGGPKLCPGVSPGKTWAGAVGGLALGILGGFGAAYGLPALSGLFSPLEIFLYATLVSAAGQIGDLCESSVKRASGVKDSAALLPAFGGLFDLVDSFILAGPVGYTLLRSWAA
jgi:phosphatidate cytidylyltransferase